ncbi:hypothetical protein Syun_020543 [Stephania yunnanensis]|uniref:Uncharacterized protein n=1 Tax=Stephania yunnanensis TaxID=152371 RepID=A0AAP0IFA4_9MAGN
MAVELQRNTAKLSKIDDLCAVLGGSPSFSSYSSTRLREIAAKVGAEFRDQVRKERVGIGIANNGNKVLHSNYKEQKSREPIQFSNEDQSKESALLAEVEEEADSEGTTDDNFEFSCVCSHHEVLTISADEIFANGQIRPIYPIFDRDHINNNQQNSIKYKESGSSSSSSSSSSTASTKSRNPLRKLFNEERVSSSWSSSDFEDLESIPRDTYCVWVPKTSDLLHFPDERCKKSSSTGTSTRWKLRDLIRRSNSDGKDSIVFLARSTSCTKSKNVREDINNQSCEQRRKIKAENLSRNRVVSAHESLYVRNRTSKEMARRQSFLPYRRDIVGFFFNVNGLGKQFKAF